MELKDFISQTIIDIVAGVKDAQDILGGNIINPHIEYTLEDRNMTDIKNKRITIETIKFKVGLTESTSSGTKNGIGVFLPKISIGHENDKANEQQSITSVEFSGPVSFPVRQ